MTPVDVGEQIKLAGCTTEQYFKKALLWNYGRKDDVYLDVLKFEIHYITPPYVKSYTRHLQQAAIRKEEDDEILDDLHLSEVANNDR